MPICCRSGVQVVDVHRILHDVVAMIIGLPVFITGLESAAGNPGGEAPAMVVAPVIGLGEFPCE